ncbi:MAG: nuclear transport factor 2 family protein [Acidobacteriota bacterium]|nr:nuclear transport factor 2 family protein [Acidobacteriota bacterium]MDQ3489037.1 nuclear transport factor 2 family protein [Acidobacteriota bacterium]
MRTETTVRPDVSVILDLNREYIEAVKRSDVRWFDRMLVDDFRCSLPDGSIIDRERFLERAAQPLDISDLQVHDVEVRLLGDAAIVHARTTFATIEGRPGAGRYTDVWARRNSQWLAAAAHFSRRID